MADLSKLADELRKLLGQAGGAINQGVQNFSKPLPQQYRGSVAPINWGNVAKQVPQTYNNAEVQVGNAVNKLAQKTNFTVPSVPVPFTAGVVNTPSFKFNPVANLQKSYKNTNDFMSALGAINPTPQQEKTINENLAFAMTPMATVERATFPQAVKILKDVTNDRGFRTNLGRIGQLIKSGRGNLGKDGEYLQSLGEQLFGKEATVGMTSKQLYNAIDVAFEEAMKKPTLTFNTGLSTKNLRGAVKERGFVTSAKEAPNVVKGVKANVKGGYVPKPNAQLENEAQALLSEGATIDFKNTKDLDRKVAATIQEALNLQKQGNHQAAANLFNNLSERGTELGRGVQAFSLLDKMSPEAIALSAAGKVKKYNLTHSAKIPELTGDQTKIIADQVAALEGLANGSREKGIALNELNKTLNSFIPSSIADKAIAVWKAGLLTSLRTHERNFLGNLIHGTAEIAKDPFAVIADKALSLKTGQRTKTFTLKGVGEFGSQKTRQQIKDIVTRGYDPTAQLEKFDYKAVNWGKNKVEQALKRYTDIVFNTLGASDKPFYNAALSRSLYDQAGAAAINAGRRGDTKFIESLVKNPPEEMFKIAVNDANIATFKNKNTATSVATAVKRALANEKNGEIASELGKLAGDITMPFTGVPSSILGQAIAYSPVGLLKGMASAGRVLASDVPQLQRQAAQEIGRGVIGTGVFALGAYLASKGLITGQPKDAAEARQWELENKPRNSIMIGGKWRSLNSIGPESIVTLAGAKFNEDINNPEKGVGGFAGDLGKDFLDQSFLTGVQQPVNAITDPARYGKSYFGNLLSSPIPNIVKDLAKSQDPYQREANSITDYAKSNVPFVRNTMLPRRDALGNIVNQEPTGASAFIDLFNSKTPISNTVVNELSRLNSVGQNATPGKLNKNQTIQGVKQSLTPEQLDALESVSGPAITAALENLFNSPGYQKLGDEEKVNAVQSVIASARKQVRGTVDVNNPQAGGQQIAGAQANETGLKDNYTIVDPETGNVKNINLAEDIPYPQLTGDEDFDKELISSYRSALNTKINNVVALYKDGQLTADQAKELVANLTKEIDKTKKPKKLPKISVSLPKQPLFKIAVPSRVKTLKIGSIKSAKPKTQNRRFTIKA